MALPSVDIESFGHGRTLDNGGVLFQPSFECSQVIDSLRKRLGLQTADVVGLALLLYRVEGVTSGSNS